MSTTVMEPTNEQHSLRPRLLQKLERLHHNTTVIHESMPRAFNNDQVAQSWSHRPLHPPHRALGNFLVLVAIPHLDRVREVVVGKAPRLLAVIEDLQQICVCPS